MMQKKQKLITIGVTLAVAAFSVHLMQRGDGRPGQVSSASVAASAATMSAPIPSPPRAEIPVAVTPTAANPEAGTLPGIAAGLVEPTPTRTESASSVLASLPVPPRDALMPAPLPQVGSDLQDRMAKISTDTAESAPAEQPRRNEFGLSCGPILSASVRDAAMVSLTLTAPCRGEQAMTVHHGDLAFTAVLDHLGIYTVEIPALRRDAIFTVSFPDGDSVEADVDVPLATTMERAALVYQGKTGLQIHALEFGADYGEDGHVWTGAPRDVASALQSGGGYMTVLGDAAQPDAILAQVYTYPGAANGQSGTVRLRVETEVTADNCETEVTGQTIEPGLAGTVNTVAMTVSMPDCTAIGEFLVLKNLLRDLRIASN